jgi:hypothetical protein
VLIRNSQFPVDQPSFSTLFRFQRFRFSGFQLLLRPWITRLSSPNAANASPNWKRRWEILICFADPKRATEILREHRKLKQTLDLWDDPRICETPTRRQSGTCEIR